MPGELPVGFDTELQSQLEGKLGYNWADQLALRWGTDWGVPCSAEMEQSLGFGWESQSADTKLATLLKLIAPPVNGSPPVGDSVAIEISGPDTASQTADQPGETTADVPGYDEQAWQAYLAENGPQWDGTEATWKQFTEWFAYHADKRSLAVPAAGLLNYLAPKPAAERVTALGEYGVTIRPAAPQETVAPGQSGYDEQAWLAYVAQNGRQWDGTEETWDQFTEWFAYHANAGGFAVPATALLKYLASQPVAERTTTLWPAGELPPEGLEEPEEPEAADEDIETIMRELLEDNPEFADVEEEIRRELVIEAINETLAKEEGRS